MKKWITLSMVIGAAGLLTMTSCQKEVTTPESENAAVQNNREAAISSRAMEQQYGVEDVDDDDIIWAQVVKLSGGEEVPAINTPTKGIAILRLSETNVLYSKIIIQKLEDGDGLLFAHIHKGAAGVNGGVLLNLADNAMEFGSNKVQQLSMEQAMSVMNDALYVNAHSSFYPSGVVRGQIR